eukprot:GHVQ01042500.1.p1 GENE.GHVQ01042500.1~~GHVQ01042500.1.p1  ORF type:complete len:113 (+),score=19.07 GHVQ01042500.1:147-485(+)
MEGTPDRPQSLRSLNVIRIMTIVMQAYLTNDQTGRGGGGGGGGEGSRGGGFVCVDMMKHPAILGFATQKSHKLVGPFLFKDGLYFGNYEYIFNYYHKQILCSKDSPLPIALF